MAIRTTDTKRAGFSLLELLLTLVIVGLIVSLAGLGVSSGSRSYEVDAAARQFADSAGYALDEAQLRGVDIGLFIGIENETSGPRYGYRWLQRAPSGWQLAAADTDVYGLQLLPEDVAVALEVEQGNALQPVEAMGAAGNAESQPQVVFFSSGETTPGIMTWLDRHTGDILWELEWDLLGRFDLRRKGEADDS